MCNFTRKMLDDSLSYPESRSQNFRTFMPDIVHQKPSDSPGTSEHTFPLTTGAKKLKGLHTDCNQFRNQVRGKKKS